MQLKSFNKLFLATLLIIFFSISLSYGQTTFGINSGTQGGNTNSYFGTKSGENNTDLNNSFFGYNSGRYNTDGSKNSFFGTNSGVSNIHGTSNSFFGTYSGENNLDGSFNTFIGRNAGYDNISGNYNLFVGSTSGRHNTIGSYNTYLGYESGNYATGNFNVFLGYQAGYNETGDNKLYIANSSTDKPLIYGDFATKHLKFNASIGIASGTTTSKITNIEHTLDGVTENYLSIRANENFGNQFLLAETGLAILGTNDIGLRHTATVDNTYLIVDGAAAKFGDAFWYSTSDKRLKKNIYPLKTSLSKFLGINFYSYQYKKTNQTRYGIMAQEMQDIFPNSMGKLIEEDGSEYLTFNPNNLFYTGFKATQEIGELTLAQETKIEQLEKENATLKSELEAIKTALKNNGIEIAENNDPKSHKEEVPHLLQNKPNPFDELTNIPYFLTNNIQQAFIFIYDANGKVIEKHQLPTKQGLSHLKLSLMKNNATKGVYSYSLIVDGNLADTKKMLLQ